MPFLLVDDALDEHRHALAQAMARDLPHEVAPRPPDLRLDALGVRGLEEVGEVLRLDVLVLHRLRLRALRRRRQRRLELRHLLRRQVRGDPRVLDRRDLELRRSVRVTPRRLHSALAPSAAPASASSSALSALEPTAVVEAVLEALLVVVLVLLLLGLLLLLGDHARPARPVGAIPGQIVAAATSCLPLLRAPPPQAELRGELLDRAFQLGEAPVVLDHTARAGPFLRERHLRRLAPGDLARPPTARSRGARLAQSVVRIDEDRLVALCERVRASTRSPGATGRPAR